MKNLIIGFISILFLNTITSGQTSDFDKIFGHLQLKQLDGNNLIETNFIEIANGKTIVLTSLAKGCKWRLEEMAYYNKLKREYPDELAVLVIFSDDKGITCL